MSDASQPDPAVAAPPFIDPESCKLWLENVPLANVAEAQQQLLAAVAEFNRASLKGAVRLATLEAMREAVNFVQVEQARRFTNRALPMAQAETAVFEHTIGLWDAIRAGYVRCLDACTAAESGMRGQGAVVCQRVLAYLGLRMFHHYRAYRQVPAADWRMLNEIYAAAERLKVPDTAVKDYLNRDINDSSPRIAYMRAMLMGMVNPNELPQRQITFVAYLLERWAEKVEISRTPIDEGPDVPPLWVDLSAAHFAERGDARGDAVRYLDARRLAKSLRNRIGLLRKGESPSKLALGEDCVQPACEQLMVFLYRQWCRPKPPRAYERKHISDVAQACNDMAAIHYYIAGKVFRQPGERREAAKKGRDEIATFGRASERDEEDYSVVHAFLLEHWQLADESVQGLRMVRRAGNQGKRFAHGQLVGVRPADSKQFTLAQVRWLMQGEGGDLHAGLRLLAGAPAAIAVRAFGIEVSAAEKFTQALSLSAAETPQMPPTLVLPVGWFKPARMIEAFIGERVRLRLNEVLERGTDFERVRYEQLPD
jgi:cyclic-di-GMP-binding protein